MINCPNCDRTVPNDALLCPYCGIRINGQSSRSSSVSTSSFFSFLRMLGIPFFVWCLVCSFCTLSSYFIGAYTPGFVSVPTLPRRITEEPTPASWMLGLGQPTVTPGTDVTVPPTQQAIPSATPVLSAALGSARENPVPPGTPVDVDDMTIRVIDAVRPANEIVASANELNPTPQPDNEYLMLSVTMTCNKGPEDACPLYVPRLTVAGPTGIRWEPEMVIVGLPNRLETQELSGDAQVEGDVIFAVGQDASDLLVVYEALSGEQVYIALPE